MAQNTILCQFCEISNEIAWKCFNCDLVLCDKCMNNHSKFRGSEEHCIIDLKQVGTPENVEIIRRFNLRRIRCTIHKEELCSLFCWDCKNIVCSFCVIAPEHKSHNFEKLSAVYSYQLSDLQDIKEKIGKNYSVLSKSVSECTSTNDNYNEIKEKIIQREKEIKEKVSAEAAELIHKLDKLIIPSKDAFIEEKLKIQEKESQVKQTNKLINEALQSHQASYVLQTIGKVDKDLQLKVNADDIPLVQKFIFTVPDSPSINFGSVKRCPILRVINTYETNVPCIKKLKSLKNGTLVFFYEKCGDHYIAYYDVQDKNCISKIEVCTISSISKLEGRVCNMTVTEDDVILFTTDNRSISKKILCMNAFDKKFKKFELSINSTNTYSPHNGIHSADKKILIGFNEHEHCTSFLILDKGVMIFDKKEYWLETYRITKRDLYFQIISIDSLTRNTNGDIIICDQHNLFVFDSKLIFKWTYQNLTGPNDIVTTPTGLIAVCDINAIHVFSMDGKLLTRIGRTEGICNPTCLHINKSGQLLVGCEGPTKLEDSKIHVVEILV